MILEALESLASYIPTYVWVSLFIIGCVFTLSIIPSLMYMACHELVKGYEWLLIALSIVHASIYSTILIACQQSIGGMQVLADPFTPPDIFIIGFLLAAAIYAAVLIYNKINYGVCYPHIMATKKGETQ